VKSSNYNSTKFALNDLLKSVFDYSKNLSCSHGSNQAVPCNGGVCSLERKSNNQYYQRCSRKDKARASVEFTGWTLGLSAIAVGNADAESELVYTCTKSMCNSVENMQKIRALLNAQNLLSASGVQLSQDQLKDPGSGAATLSTMSLLIPLIITCLMKAI
jgi:hypothetical protein